MSREDKKTVILGTIVVAALVIPALLGVDLVAVLQADPRTSVCGALISIGIGHGFLT